MVVGIVGTSHFVGEWRRWRQLEDDQAGFAVAKVTARQDKYPYAARPRKVIHLVEIGYAFTAGAAEIQSTVLCSDECGELARVQPGDEIKVRYSRKDPRFNRAVSLGLDSMIGFKVMALAGLAITAMAMWAVWTGGVRREQ